MNEKSENMNYILFGRLKLLKMRETNEMTEANSINGQRRGEETHQMKNMSYNGCLLCCKYMCAGDVATEFVRPFAMFCFAYEWKANIIATLVVCV